MEKSPEKKTSESTIKIAAEILEKSHHLYSSILKHQNDLISPVTAGRMANLTHEYQEFWQKLFQNPAKLARVQMHYWQDYLRLIQNTTLNWLGKKSTPQAQNHEIIDKRFKSEDWDKNPVFAFIRQFYLMTAEYIQKIVNEVEDLDPKTAKNIDFYTRQMIDAMSPTNFLFTNPEALRKAFDTKGMTLLKGFRNFLEDLERSGGKLNIKMTDLEAFAVGENLAATKGKVIFQNKLIQLIQYEAQTKKVHEIPLLMIPPWINKYYILDLSPEKSLVNWLVNQGYSIFMISWVNPDHQFAQYDFADYLEQGALAALNVVKKISGKKQINALGFCIGGTLLGTLLAYLSEKKDTSIQSATYLATLLDFSDPGDMGVLIDEEKIRLLELDMERKGYLDGGDMSMTFNMLRANDLIWSYFIKNYLQGENPFSFDLLYWNADATNMPAKMHSTYLRKMYHENVLATPNALTLLGVPIDLTKSNVPVYFISTHHDHIAPWESTYKGALMHQGETTFVLGGSGHIAGIINPPALKKYCYYTSNQLPAESEKWLAGAKQNEGSWWPHWEKWLSQYSGNMGSPLPLGKDKFKAIEDAPGSYVQVKLSQTKK